MSVPLQDCPTCGHNTSAFAGACTAFVLEDGGGFGYCGHDCTVDLYGESIWDKITRSFQEAHGKTEEKTVSEDREIRTAEDAEAKDVREAVEAVFSGWFADEPRIDWENFLDRLEGYGFDLGEDMLSPAIERIKKIVRELRQA